MSVFEGYQSDVSKDEGLGNGLPYELLEIKLNHLDFYIDYKQDKNTYLVVGGNLVVSGEIELFRGDGGLILSGSPLALPEPVIEVSGTCQTREGNTFFYQINSFGFVNLQGEFKSSSDTLLFNFAPYLSKFPLEIREFNVST